MKRKNKILNLCLCALLTGSMSVSPVSAATITKNSPGVPMTETLFKQYQEAAIKEAVFVVEYRDGHKEEYYWSMEMKLPVKADEIKKDIVDLSNVENIITVTPDNVKKTLVEKEEYFTCFFYNYSADKWENDGFYIHKMVMPDDAVEKYSQAVNEAVITVEKKDGSVEKYYYWMQLSDFPIRAEEISAIIDLSKVEKTITVTEDKNGILIEKLSGYAQMYYDNSVSNEEYSHWTQLDIFTPKVYPLDDYLSSPVVIPIPEDSVITGDVNKDGTVNIVDLVELNRVLLDEHAYSEKYNYDVDSNKVVSVADISKLKSILLEC